MEATDLTWRKARKSGNGGGNCVEVGRSAADADVRVRDTKSRERGHLTVTAATWRRFTDDLKAGRLDIPALPAHG